MIVSNNVNAYTAIPVNIAVDLEKPVTTSKLVTEPDGSTVVQYTTVTPNGSIMRKHITLNEADALPGTSLSGISGPYSNRTANLTDPADPASMLRRRAQAYEGMMWIV